MRISDWSSDVCSSDLNLLLQIGDLRVEFGGEAFQHLAIDFDAVTLHASDHGDHRPVDQLIDSGDTLGRQTGLEPRPEPQGHVRSEEHTSELQSLMRISYAVFCLKKKKHNSNITPNDLSTNLT